MANDVAESGVVERYMLHLYIAKENVRNELARRGYEPDEIAKLSLDMALEVDNHLRSGKEIAEKRMKKSREDPTEDYRQIFRRVDRMFGGKAYVVNGITDNIDAFYDHEKDVYVLSAHAFAECSVGHGEIYRTHEGRHELQRKIHGRLLAGSYTEGEAELYSVTEMSRAGDSKQLLMRYIGLLRVSSKAERIIALKNCLATGQAESDYNQYVLSPAVMLHLKNAGKTDSDILEYYKSANGRMELVGVKEALLEGLE